MGVYPCVQCITLLLIILTYDAGCEVRPTRDKSKWIDPNDMLGPESGSYRRPPASKDGIAFEVPENSFEELTQQMADVESRLASCESGSKRLEDQLEKCENRTKQCDVLKELPFFKQYIRSLINKLPRLSSATTNDGSYVLDVRLSPEEIRYLSQYSLSGTGSVQEVHTILSVSFLKYIRWADRDPKASAWIDWELFPSRVSTLVQVVLVLCLSAHALHLILRFNFRSYFRLAMALIILSFLISVPWTWWHLYKIKLAERHQVLMKGREGMESCQASQQSFGGHIKAWLFGRSDECAKYFEKLEIDPMWEVPPTQAVAVTFSRFFLEPAGHIGEAIRLLMTRAFDGLPFYLWVPVFAIIILLIVLGLFVGSGYRLRTLFFAIEPHRGREQPAIPEATQQELLQLRSEVNNLQNENRALRHSNEQFARGFDRIQSVTDGRETVGAGNALATLTASSSCSRVMETSGGFTILQGGESRQGTRVMDRAALPVSIQSSNQDHPLVGVGLSEQVGLRHRTVTSESSQPVHSSDGNEDQSGTVGQIHQGGGDGLAARNKSENITSAACMASDGSGDALRAFACSRKEEERTEFSSATARFDTIKPTAGFGEESLNKSTDSTGEINIKLQKLQIDTCPDTPVLEGNSLVPEEGDISKVVSQNADGRDVKKRKKSNESLTNFGESGSTSECTADLTTASISSATSGCDIPKSPESPENPRANPSADDDSDYEIIEPDIRSSNRN